MKIKFDNSLGYQQDAIRAVVDVFKGQEVCNSNFTVYSAEFLASMPAMEFNQLGVANKMQVHEGQVLENVQRIQLKNGLKPSSREELDHKHLDLSIEMETGTGKTYVYLRSIMEMNRQYGFSKFIIVVPSIPIKEGVFKSLQMTESHFKEHYANINYKYFIYDSSRLNDIREFATSDQLQIMVINIQAFAKDMDDDKSNTNRILLNYNDKLGYKPISLIQDTKPIVIIDEPQKVMNSPLGKKSIRNLKPLAMLRYSATHKEKVNLLYKLDAVDAYNLQLVKQIEVASLKVEGEAKPGAYLKLVSTSNRNGFSAVLELDVKGKDGKAKRANKTVKVGTDLLQVTKMDEYDNLIVRHIYADKGSEYIDFTNDVELKVNETSGSVDDLLIKRLQISKTIEEHLDKELILNPKGIKVLSLFFIDKVSNYRIYDEEGNPQNGTYAKIFEEEYKKIIKRSRYKSLFEGIKDMQAEASEIHNGYFSIDRKPKASNSKMKFDYFKDSNGTTKADESTYEWIMKEKEGLLSFGNEGVNKLRFIFSHTALREGWDNPNVFQICTLKESGGSDISRRQEIGRGLRLCVNQSGDRVYGFDTNTLTVVASESYEDFVRNLQKDIEQETGIVFGIVKSHSFSSIVTRMDGTEQVHLGQEESEKLYQYLFGRGYIDNKGKVQDSLKSALKARAVELPEDMAEEVKAQVVTILKEVAGKLEIKRSDDKQVVKVKKEVLLSPDFKELWDKVKFKTTYSVNFDSAKLIEACIKNISNRLIVSRGKLIYTTNTIEITKGGVHSPDKGISTVTSLEQEVNMLPDIVTYLQNETNLTRRSIVQILRGCTNLKYFKINPQKYIEGCIDIINEQMRLHIVDGIVYKKIGDLEYYSQELFQNEELIGYLKSNMLESSKSPYEYVVYDSMVENELAQQFESLSNVKVYVKLPGWFKIDTPLGTYNPDWAVLFEKDNIEKLYFVVESKGTMNIDFLRPSEVGKIECGKKHFEELSRVTGSQISLEHVRDMNDFLTVAMGQ
jgi:type III restriction enzyme